MPPPIFGAHANPEAILDPADLFTLYAGGRLDATFLGLAEADAEGNVNVSRFGSALTGCGGFIDITARTPRIYICGMLAAKGAEVVLRDGGVVVEREGQVKKLVPRVGQVTLNGRLALERGQRVALVTERGLFRLEREGWVLHEVAPGLDPKRDIAPAIGFPLLVSPALRPYGPELPAGPGGLAWLAERLE
jgi:propionate CoA-transferase